jgi:glucose dehydrogenase
MAVVLSAGLLARAANWPQFRGLGARGVDESQVSPTNWNVETGANIRWQIYLTSGHGRYQPIRAVRAEAAGDITPSDPGQTNSAIVWAHARRGNYMQTPIVVGNLLFACNDAGMMTCFDAATGAVNYNQRLGTSGQGFTASPVSDGRHVYFTSEQGLVFVVAVANRYSLAGCNELHETCLATPAMANGTLFFRTREKLIAVGAGSGGPH